MPDSKRKGAAMICLVLGIALFGGSFVIDVSGLRGAGIAFLVFGLILWLSARKSTQGPGA
jgi:hypothetical protein